MCFPGSIATRQEMGHPRESHFHGSELVAGQHAATSPELPETTLSQNKKMFSVTHIESGGDRKTHDATLQSALCNHCQKCGEEDHQAPNELQTDGQPPAPGEDS